MTRNFVKLGKIAIFVGHWSRSLGLRRRICTGTRLRFHRESDLPSKSTNQTCLLVKLTLKLFFANYPVGFPVVADQGSSESTGWVHARSSVRNCSEVTRIPDEFLLNFSNNMLLSTATVHHKRRFIHRPATRNKKVISGGGVGGVPIL